MTPSKHLQGQGCKICAKNKVSEKLSLTTDEFKRKCIEKYGDLFILDKIEYINSKTKVCVTCRKHGDFWITPNNFLRGHNCEKCKREKISKLKHYNNDIFKEKGNKKHNNEYDYTKTEYVNSLTKVCIICPIHGEFWQTPADHLYGYGCPKCGGTMKLNENEFLKKKKKIHNDSYSYKDLHYVNIKTKIDIFCNKCGNVFQQTPLDHLTGRGCPNCKRSKSEIKVEQFLQENKIKYQGQKKFTWLGLQSLDFYLPDYNIAIECQGEQHFKPVEHFGGIDSYEITKKRDKLKYELCKENDIKLFYFVNFSFQNSIYNAIYKKENTFYEIEKLFNVILS